MQIIFSPAKKMASKPCQIVYYQNLAKNFTEPRYLDKSQQLLQIVKQFSATDLAKLMAISQDLGKLNQRRFARLNLLNLSLKGKKPKELANRIQDLELDPSPAILLFCGESYRALDVLQATKEQLLWMQKTISILSGFYGLLKPLDLILPYRLEMGTRLANDKGTNLYHFWGENLKEQLLQDILASSDKNNHESRILINLASNEYFKAVADKEFYKQLQERQISFINFHFLFIEQGVKKPVGQFSKVLRGQIAKYLVQQLADEVYPSISKVLNVLKKFQFEDLKMRVFKFNEKYSNFATKNLFFTANKIAKKS